MTYTVDRLEGTLAVCENDQTGEILNIPITDFPDTPREGLSFAFSNGIIHFCENSRKTKVQRLMDDIWE